MKKIIAFFTIIAGFSLGCEGYQTQGGPEFSYGMHKGYTGQPHDCASVYSSGTSAYVCNLGYQWGASNRPGARPVGRPPAVAPSRASAPGVSTGLYGYGRQVMTGIPPQLGPTGFA